jgi:acyl carrier protein
MTDIVGTHPPAPNLNEGSPIDPGEAISDIIAVQLGVARTSITSATSFEEMGADIYDLAVIIVSLEEALGVVIDDQEVDRLLTVGDLIAEVKCRRLDPPTLKRPRTD